jgi:hypothetical protein
LIALAAGSGLTWVARCNPATGYQMRPEVSAVKHETLRRALMPDANMMGR